MEEDNNIHYGPVQQGEPNIDPEVWRKAKRLVQIYRPQLLQHPFLTVTKRWRKQIERDEEGWFYINDQIIEDARRKYERRLQFQADGPTKYLWHLAHIEVVSIDLYPKTRYDFQHEVNSPFLF